MMWQRLYDDMAIGDVEFNYWYLMDGCCGATWPSHGLPHGTVVIGYWFKNFMESMWFEPRTSSHHGKP
jgi:hypothetical protein